MKNSEIKEGKSYCWAHTDRESGEPTREQVKVVRKTGVAGRVENRGAPDEAKGKPFPAHGEEDYWVEIELESGDRLKVKSGELHPAEGC